VTGRARWAAPLLLALAATAGCGGGPPADLFVVTRTGTIPGAALKLRLTDDGGAYCGDARRAEITSAQLIEARALRRLLDGDDPHVKGPGLAEQGIRLRPGRVTTLSYRVLSEKGTVVFSDTSAHQPQAFYRLAKLTRDVAIGDCHLPR
jgi:hypothetical protein